jgi:hypothetical protein
MQPGSTSAVRRELEQARFHLAREVCLNQDRITVEASPVLGVRLMHRVSQLDSTAPADNGSSRVPCSDAR